jgi:hypothetical protein
MRHTLTGLLLLAAGASAWAQAPVRANERFCLESYGRGGLGPMMCHFETMEQCIAAKGFQGDRCLLNPYLAFQQRNR